eukprot:gene29796-7431_t
MLTVFAPRAVESNAHGLLDSRAVYIRQLALDWRKALARGRLQSMLSEQAVNVKWNVKKLDKSMLSKQAVNVKRNVKKLDKALSRGRLQSMLLEQAVNVKRNVKKLDKAALEELHGALESSMGRL